MKLAVAWIGKTDEQYLKEGILLYVKRIQRCVPFEVLEIPGVKQSKHVPVKDQRENESEVILKYIKPDDYLVLLDEKGNTFSSVRFSKYIETKLAGSSKRVMFLIGGAYGFSQALYDRANDKVSLSEMTFSHQLVRVLFLEQLYRAFTIIRGEPYHNP